MTVWFVPIFFIAAFLEAIVKMIPMLVGPSLPPRTTWTRPLTVQHPVLIQFLRAGLVTLSCSPSKIVRYQRFCVVTRFFAYYSLLLLLANLFCDGTICSSNNSCAPSRSLDSSFLFGRPTGNLQLFGMHRPAIDIPPLFRRARARTASFRIPAGRAGGMPGNSLAILRTFSFLAQGDLK